MVTTVTEGSVLLLSSGGLCLLMLAGTVQVIYGRQFSVTCLANHFAFSLLLYSFSP